MQAAGGAPLTSEQSEQSEPSPSPEPSAPAAPSEHGRLLPLLLALAAVVLAADIATKALVVARLEGRRDVSLLGGHLLLRVSRNSGAAFSFAEGATIVFTLVAVAVVVVILRTARRLRSVGWAIALGLLLGGASGNLLDRLVRSPGIGRGRVVDFIDFLVWPSFNVADSCIVTGGLLAVLLSFLAVDIDGTRPRSQR